AAPAVVDEPAAPAVVDEPAAPAVVDEPIEPAVVDEAAAPVTVDEPAALVVEPPPEGPMHGPPTLAEVTGEMRARAAAIRGELPARRAALRAERIRIERDFGRARDTARTTSAVEQARRTAVRDRAAAHEEEMAIRRREGEAQVLERQARELEEAAARVRAPARDPADIAAEQSHGPDDTPAASDSPATVGTVSQNADLARWITRLRELGATDIRVDQIQVNAMRRVVGINRPDLQFTLNGERFYMEWDTPSSTRGRPHARRTWANDPRAVGVREMTVEPEYPLPDIATTPERIILITME
ncbi:MAG: hypothetical protein ABI728_02200, partial [Betaproteobacteria bacterium]